MLYEKCINEGIDNNLVEAMKQCPIENIAALSNMFHLAVTYTNASSDELIKKTRFSISDMTPERLYTGVDIFIIESLSFF